MMRVEHDRAALISRYNDGKGGWLCDPVHPY
jgi:hypothetical protein